jgi:hypothetical protein
VKGLAMLLIAVVEVYDLARGLLAKTRRKTKPPTKTPKQRT